MPEVNIVNVVKKFGDFTALHGVNMKVESGEYVSIVGPSGCGKTTLLRIIAGIIPPTKGEIFFDDRLMNDVPVEERGIGYVFQNIALFPHMNLWDNVSYGLKVRGKPYDETHSVTLEMLELMKLTERYRDFPHELSGGMQQKAAVARALATGTSLLLLDEPLSMLDAKVREKLRYELRKIVKDLDLTAIHVTHDQEEAIAISDRIFIMRRGEIVEYGNPIDLYLSPRKIFTSYFLGESNVLEGIVIDRKSDEVEVQIGNISLKAYGEGFQKDERVVVIFRPELARLEPGGSMRIVERSIEKGYYRYILKDKSQKFIVKTFEKFDIDGKIDLRIPKEYVRVYKYPERGLNNEIALR